MCVRGVWGGVWVCVCGCVGLENVLNIYSHIYMLVTCMFFSKNSRASHSLSSKVHVCGLPTVVLASAMEI